MGQRTAVLVVGHGSRLSESNQHFLSLVDTFAHHYPQYDVQLGYIELAQPHFSETLSSLSEFYQRIIIAPLMLFASAHVKNDLPLVVEAQKRKTPDVTIVVTRALGVSTDMVNALGSRGSEALDMTSALQKDTVAVVVGRGSSDPDANGDFFKIVRLFGETHGFSHVVPCFVGITGPRLPETLNFVSRLRPQNLLVVPYFLFTGRLLERIAQQVGSFSQSHGWINTQVAGPLDKHAGVISCLAERVEQAQSGLAPLPCNTCQYRVPIGKVSKNVGGLEALMYSVRHSLTHSQAMPHEHAHKPMKKHVLVCTNVDCANRGAIPLVRSLRREIKRSGAHRSIRVTKTSCMGRCGEGPTVAVYPDGIWYRDVQSEDASELVEEHLLGGKLLSRLVDNIMQ